MARTSRRRPTRSSRSRSRARARRSSAPGLGLPQLAPHQIDLLGLGLAALGIFLAFVMYAGSAGGQVGDGLRDGLMLLFGRVAYAAPIGLVIGGVLVIARTLIPSVKPLRAGVWCLFGAVELSLAAGTLGLGGGGRPGNDMWDADVIKERGGAIGEALYWVASTLFSDVGAHIIAIFLFLAALVLLSGVTIASVLQQAAETSRTLAPARRSYEDEEPPPAPRRAARRRKTIVAADDDAVLAASTDPDVPELLTPPELEPARLVVRATPGDAPSLDGAERYPDLFGDEDDAPTLAPAPLAPIDYDEPDDGDTADFAASAALAATPDDEDDDADEPVAADEAEIPELELEEPDEPGVTTGPTEPVDPADLTPQGRYRASVTDSPDFVWQVPSSRFLKRSTAEQTRPDTAGQEKIAAQLVEALEHFKIDSKVVGMVAGPHITRYELRLAPGTRVGRVANLKDDLAYALAATDVRILAPIPGKQAVGVEVPNAKRKIVHLGDVFQEPPSDWSPLTVWLGKDVAGRAIGVDLAKMPHLLVAGTTGAGKSGCVNAMLSSILLHADPREVKLVLVDPKQVELNHYESIPHLLTPVITSPRKAANALQNLVKEMEERYGIMSLARTRSLPELNRRREERGESRLPYILCVIDELADLMMVAPADVEDSIIRLAQKARAVGIHLVLATQSPRVDVITGMIKANVPSRIAFAVSSQTDSRVILDQNGAESLLGQGDMLFSPVGSSKLQRIQGAYVDEDQIAKLTESWRRQGEPELRDDLLEEVEDEDAAAEEQSADDGFDPDEDPLLEEAIGLVAQMGTASTSMLQRRLRLGYTRAGRLIDMLERRGIISGYEGSKPRQVLITESDVPRILVALAERAGPPPGERPGDQIPLPTPSSGAADDEPTLS
ncbi:DNA translocase FtsK [Conexibacter sp. JD483]|uniref:DNA translocase FtsK n=1 Tax=unclassified Conexibacter TaxID=2627773 RepID=UPI0027209EF3|nr:MULTISPECIES: DNA translocase FtsK [unclassified Conexibacter]MDO8188090.1 DNA translocase FtsK [Conexibacter sp. CPCC 205706]MDO8196914.1 DNA translocase FtsK [Conexibacter sp. CPCC 205762]MDR9370043.1 DNA translocase FtsK [Conexibacter sp. JD483]